MNLDKIREQVEKVFEKYELCHIVEKEKRIETKNGALHGFETKEEEGVALRAIEDNRLVFSYAYGDEEGIAAQLIGNAKALLPFMEEEDGLDFIMPCEELPAMDGCDREGLEKDDNLKLQVVGEMEKIILEYDKRIVNTRNCELSESYYLENIVNSKGLDVRGEKTLYTLSGLAVGRGDDEVSYYDWTWAESLKDLRASELGLDIAKRTISYLSGKQIQTGLYNALLTPRAACDLLEILAQSFLGENLYKDKTRLKAKIGKCCFSENITMIDSGLRGTGAFPFDGEGASSKETVVVQGGYFNTFLFDSYYAKKMGRQSTGNSVRAGLKEPPRCSVRGLFVQSGNANIPDDFGDGVIVDELMGTHTANTITGDFSLGAVGFVRKGGEDLPFKGVILSGNVFSLFDSVASIGNDLRFYGTFGSPSIAVEKISISGTS